MLKRLRIEFQVQLGDDAYDIYIHNTLTNYWA